MAATKTKARAKKAKAPTKSKAKPTAKAKPKAAAKKAAAPKKPVAAKAKKPAAAKAKAKKPAPPPVVDVMEDVIDAPAAEAGADESSNGEVSETAKTGAFARIKKGVGSFFSKIARKKPQQPADDDAGDEAPPTIEVATGDILVEADDRAKLRAASRSSSRPPPPPQPNDDDE